MSVEKEVEKFLADEYGDTMIAFNDNLFYESNLFAHEVDTPYGKIVRLQTSPTTKGGVGTTFWNWR